MVKNKPTLESLEAKIDLLMAKVDEIRVLEAKVETLESTVSTLSGTVDQLKEQVNHRDQQLRGNSARVYGLSTSADEDDDARSLVKRVYKAIVKPVLVVAKANKLIDTIPNMQCTIQDAYRVRVFAGQSRIAGQLSQPPAPIIIKFVSPAVRLAFFRSKRLGLPAPSEADKAAGTKKYGVSEDLTGPNYKKFKEMVASDRVEKVWSVDGRLRYTVPGDKTVRRIKSVFASLADSLNSD